MSSHNKNNTTHHSDASGQRSTRNVKWTRFKRQTTICRAPQYFTVPVWWIFWLWQMHARMCDIIRSNGCGSLPPVHSTWPGSVWSATSGWDYCGHAAVGRTTCTRGTTTQWRTPSWWKEAVRSGRTRGSCWRSQVICEWPETRMCSSWWYISKKMNEQFGRIEYVGNICCMEI